MLYQYSHFKTKIHSKSLCLKSEFNRAFDTYIYKVINIVIHDKDLFFIFALILSVDPHHSIFALHNKNIIVIKILFYFVSSSHFIAAIQIDIAHEVFFIEATCYWPKLFHFLSHS